MSASSVSSAVSASLSAAGGSAAVGRFGAWSGGLGRERERRRAGSFVRLAWCHLRTIASVPVSSDAKSCANTVLGVILGCF